MPIAIEQDLLWVADSAGGHSIVSHGGAPTGHEPTLEQYFFERVTPMMEQALRDGRRDRWPILILHLDFKTNEAAHHRAIWTLLGRYSSWLTTAERPADPRTIAPLVPGPLLILTENGDGQAQTFYDEVPVGQSLRIFGTVASTQERPVPVADSAAALPRSYRRWVNLSWAAAEGERQPAAGPWTSAKRQRLDQLVTAAHGAGWWIRFYTLNGHAADDSRGWTPDYNFGSLGAVRERWRAAIDATVDLIATDQYEDLARELSASNGGLR